MDKLSDNKIYTNKKGQYHRVDGPAVEWPNGIKFWYINGKLHRDNGPAIEYANGDQSWYLNGKKHRIGGPAIQWVGISQWWIEGIQYIEEEYNEKVKEYEQSNN